MNRHGYCKSFSAALVLTMVLMSGLGFENFVCVGETTAAHSPTNLTLGKDGYSLSWDSNAQSNFVDNQSSVEMVIGVNSKPNSFAEISRLIGLSGGKIDNSLMIGMKQAIIASIPTKSATSFSAQVHTSGLETYLELNKKYKIDSTPNDQYWSLQWGPKKVAADYAWDTTTGNKTVLVAVVDTGIDYTHPDLIANYVPLGYNWVNRNNRPMDDNGHGTHVAGIIAATYNNSIGIAGMAQVRIMAEKSLDSEGSGYEDDLANAIVHATDQGAKIISNSWGSNETSSLIHDAIMYARSKGVVVFAAAGNEGDNQPQYPGAYDEVICVSATNRTDTPASFTSYGDWVDVAAPGVQIASTYPNGSYAYMSGTSMATPMAAGTAALIWSRFPNMTADQVRYQLEGTCDDLGPLGFDIYFGNGRINARKAVEQTQPDDLVITNWATPNEFIKVGLAYGFNATVFNRGSNTQTAIQVKLFANGTVVNSTLIASLSSGTYAYPSMTWKPTIAGTYNVTIYVVPQTGEAITQNNIVTKNFTAGIPPAPTNWTLLATDIDEGQGSNLKAVYSQLQSNTVYFKVQYHRTWSNASSDIDTAILLDTDRNPRTGLPDKYYVNQNSNLGSDFMILIGGEGPALWQWKNELMFFDTANTLGVSYLDAQDNVAEFIVGVKSTDIGTNGTFNFAVADIYSNWDWIPNSGNRPFIEANSSHELAVTIFNPFSLQPGEISELNATVYNFGISSETNVNIEILLNGTVVRSNRVAQLSSGSSYSIVYVWTPSVEAVYNVTAYSYTVVGESNILNNVGSVMVPVSPKIALISDWAELTSITPILDSMWINYDSYNYNYYYLYTESLTLLNIYRAVIFCKTDRSITLIEQSTLNSYLSEGGNLLVTGIDSLGHPNDIRLANVVRSSGVGDDYGQPDLYVTNSSHPIMNGAYRKLPLGYHISDLYDDTDAAKADTARNAFTIAQLVDGNDKIIATDSLPGKVVYWNGFGVSDWVENIDCAAILKNLLVWFVDASPPVTANDYDGAWHTADFSIKLNAADYFDVNQTYYKVNTGATKSVSSNGQPLITTENANNTLEYWSVDSLGNQEVHRLLTGIKLDKTAPTGYIQINNGNNYATSPDVILTLMAIDSMSGVSEFRYSNDGNWDTELWEAASTTKAWSLPPGDGAKTVYFQIKDAAGLTSPTYSNNITLDTIPPLGSISINNNEKFTTTPTVNLTLSMADDNFDVATMRFSNDNIAWSTWQKYSSSMVWNLQNIDGEKIVYVQIRDNSGLTATYNTSITLDSTAPSISVGQPQTTTQGSSITLSGSANDASGVYSYIWSFGDGPQATGATVTHNYMNFGRYIATLTVQDMAGNIAMATVEIFVNPQTAPTPSSSPSPTTTSFPSPIVTPTQKPAATPISSPSVVPSTSKGDSFIDNLLPTLLTILVGALLISFVTVLHFRQHKK